MSSQICHIFMLLSACESEGLANISDLIAPTVALFHFSSMISQQQMSLPIVHLNVQLTFLPYFSSFYRYPTATKW